MRYERTVGGLAGLLTVNAAYLVSSNAATYFYLANVLLHLVLGLGLLLVLFILLGRSRTQASRFVRYGWYFLWFAGVVGLILMITGTTRPYRWLLYGHILSASCGFVFLLLGALWNRRRQWAIPAAGGAASAVLLLASWFPFDADPHDRITNPKIVPASLEEETGGRGPFFPSTAATVTGKPVPSRYFMNSQSCGRSGCHPDVVAQWEVSAHRHASFNNQWYRKSVEYMQDVVGTEPSKWCGGCHDHALLFSGMMDQPVREQLDKPEAHLGITCVSCHLISEVKSTMGNAAFVLDYPPLHDLATSENPIIEKLHDYFVKLDPGPHRTTFLKPFMREQLGEFCSTCHKAHLDVPVNQYRWLRGFNEYDGWQSSGVSGQGARSFYYPSQPQDCADCHMPLVLSADAGNRAGVVHDHSFLGPNTALPLVNGHQDHLERTIAFLQADQVSIDLFALSRPSSEEHQTTLLESLTGQTASTFAEGDELGLTARGRGAGYTDDSEIVAPLDRARPPLRRGETVRIEVVVRTKNVGHFFPGGTVDAFDVWVELQAVDDRGRLLFWSGFVPEDSNGRIGPVDPGAHFYRSAQVDAQGNPINKRNAWMTRAVAYVRLIPPGAADTVHYRLHVPEDAGDAIHLRARLNYRKFSWWYTHWAYAGLRDPTDKRARWGPGFDSGRWIFTADTGGVSGLLKEIPDVPVVVMAETSVDLPVVEGDAHTERESVLHPDDLIRWNDYGIGLLLQGDLRAAERVFQTVTEIQPAFADGWVNVGRTRVLEGRSEEARTVLKRALEIDPNLARAHYFLALVEKAEGNYENALHHLYTAEARYPRDRVVLNQIGRILFLQRRFEDAEAYLVRVLQIDPEDLQAHYNLMLCYRALKRPDAAAREQMLYLRFKADESSQSIVGPYLRDHPHENNERQAIHEHVSYPLQEIPERDALTSVQDRPFQ
ncbi:MAG TPA: tetratricopeptide repeat protein [Acidobacteriota bacterium]|nr:tetratricopeptide repeat protein [Acidobacteriota bacterium]